MNRPPLENLTKSNKGKKASTFVVVLAMGELCDVGGEGTWGRRKGDMGGSLCHTVLKFATGCFRRAKALLPCHSPTRSSLPITTGSCTPPEKWKELSLQVGPCPPSGEEGTGHGEEVFSLPFSRVFLEEPLVALSPRLTTLEIPPLAQSISLHITLAPG